jgi:FMN phosphatase YigB (HAD superfamily)
MKNLIFDFDGVLGNTWEAVMHALVASGREADRAGAIRNATEYFSKKPHHARNHSLSDEQMAAEYEWVSRFGSFVDEYGFPMFSDFVQAIELLPNKRVAVVSSGSQNHVLPAIEKTNLHPTHILAFEDHHSKEEKIELVCRDWGVAVSEVYYFTDTLADIYELRDMIAEDKLIAVSWGYCTKEQLSTELSEEYILDTARDMKLLFT